MGYNRGVKGFDHSQGAVKLLTGKDLPAEGRDRLLVVAIDLIYADGFGAVDAARVCAESGMTSAQFEEHFGGIEDLFEQAVRLHDAWEREAWLRCVEEIAPGDPRGQLLAVFNFMEDVFRNPNYKGCLFITAAGAFSDRDHPVHKACREHKRETRRWIAEMARAAGVVYPDWFADEYMAIFEGALILEQVHQHDDAVRVTRPMIERLLATHLDET